MRRDERVQLKSQLGQSRESILERNTGFDTDNGALLNFTNDYISRLAAGI